MPYIADRVQDTAANPGAGAFTLNGTPPTGYQSFPTAFGSDAKTVQYLGVQGANWEVGKGTFNGTTGLTRDAIRSSSNGGSLVTFTGTVTVYCTASAELLDNANIGMLYAANRGWAMP
jgi:hypothetical protein